MYVAIRPLGLPIKGYAALLAAVSTAAVVAGGAINFTYARNHPGADPYMPRPSIATPAVPAPLPEPAAPSQVKKLPVDTTPLGDDPAQAPAVSSNKPNQFAELTGSGKCVFCKAGSLNIGKSFDKGGALSIDKPLDVISKRITIAYRNEAGILERTIADVKAMPHNLLVWLVTAFALVVSLSCILSLISTVLILRRN